MNQKYKQIVYHGTKHTVNENPCISNQSFKQGIYFTDNLKLEREYNIETQV